jgi:peptide chain release factor 3
VSAALGDATVAQGAWHRRSIALISHPDAGKSNLTEVFALGAHAMDRAGAVHGNGGRDRTVSDWLEVERARGISISSAA